jgi:hypothetical protein
MRIITWKINQSTKKKKKKPEQQHQPLTSTSTCRQIVDFSDGYLCPEIRRKFFKTKTVMKVKCRKMVWFWLQCVWNALKWTVLFKHWADPGGRAVSGVALWPSDCWDCGFESRWGSEYSSLEFVVCCVGRGLCDELITRPEEPYQVCVCVCVCVCVISQPRQWGGPVTSWAVAPQKEK